MYGTSFSNKLWLLTKNEPSLVAVKSALLSSISMESNYIGHINVTVVRDKKGCYYGNDIKFGQTPAAGFGVFAHSLLESTRKLTEEVTFNISELPTRR